jgi:hypothetical protein
MSWSKLPSPPVLYSRQLLSSHRKQLEGGVQPPFPFPPVYVYEYDVWMMDFVGLDSIRAAMDVWMMDMYVTWDLLVLLTS